MSRLWDTLTRETVRNTVTVVNTLVTDMPRVPEHTARREAGRRLKATLDELYPRGRGGLRKLADEAKVGPETLYRWFRGDSEPDLGTLRRVAAACKVSRTDLVAAMDDDRAEPPSWQQVAERLARVEERLSESVVLELTPEQLMAVGIRAAESADHRRASEETGASTGSEAQVPAGAARQEGAP